MVQCRTTTAAPILGAHDRPENAMPLDAADRYKNSLRKAEGKDFQALR